MYFICIIIFSIFFFSDPFGIVQNMTQDENLQMGLKAILGIGGGALIAGAIDRSKED